MDLYVRNAQLQGIVQTQGGCIENDTPLCYYVLGKRFIATVNREIDSFFVV